jgi:hypothetical protein
MAKCAKATMKDLLPDLLHDRLPAALRAEVEAHVTVCDDCRAELLILRHVIAVSAPAATPRIDASRIVAVLPRYRTPSTWQRTIHSAQLRMAAAVVLLAGGAAVLSNVMTRSEKPESTRIIARAPASPDTSVAVVPAVGSSAAAATPSVRHVSTELALGETLHDLSDTELRALLDEMGNLEAVTPTETEVVAPAVGRGTQ